MRKDEAYLDVAKRYLASCEKHLDNGVQLQEVIGFKSYHAFESAAGAFNSHYNRPVPRNHAHKLNAFVANARQHPGVDPKIVAKLAILLNSVRNLYLYPEETRMGFIRPQDQISMTDARKIVSRVKGILKGVERMI